VAAALSLLLPPFFFEGCVMAEGKTSVCNMSLSRFGSKRINDFDDNTESSTQIIYCRLFFENTAKALMRSHFWRFARDRVELSQDTNDPAFQWDYAYHLPSDFLRHILVYDGSDLPEGRTFVSYELEGNRLLIDESEVYIKYIKWVSDVGKWDPLFIEVMVLQLAQKLCMPLSQDLAVNAEGPGDGP
jgi:hypothetical protein